MNGRGGKSGRTVPVLSAADAKRDDTEGKHDATRR